MSRNLTVLRTALDVPGAQTDVPVVAAVPNRSIRVISAIITAEALTAIRFESDGVVDTNLTSDLDLPVEAPLWVLPLNEYGWFETLPGQALLVNTGPGAVSLLVLYALA